MTEMSNGPRDCSSIPRLVVLSARLDGVVAALPLQVRSDPLPDLPPAAVYQRIPTVTAMAISRSTAAVVVSGATSASSRCHMASALGAASVSEVVT